MLLMFRFWSGNDQNLALNSCFVTSDTAGVVQRSETSRGVVNCGQLMFIYKGNIRWNVEMPLCHEQHVQRRYQTVSGFTSSSGLTALKLKRRINWCYFTSTNRRTTNTLTSRRWNRKCKLIFQNQDPAALWLPVCRCQLQTQLIQLKK